MLVAAWSAHDSRRVGLGRSGRQSSGRLCLCLAPLGLQEREASYGATKPYQPMIRSLLAMGDRSAGWVAVKQSWWWW
jgi:hypothetical protein